jgi:hypothetical protein
MSFAALYPDECSECGGPIHPGDEIRYDWLDTLVHDLCPPERKTTTCPKCFIIQPCECE